MISTSREATATIAMSRFRVANGMSAQVAAAFASRPHLVDRVPGFLGLETFTDKKDPDVFYLITRWTDGDAFHAWHDGAAHHASHSFIPRGLKLDPSYTSVVVMDRLPASEGDGNEALVHDETLLVSDFLSDATTIILASATPDGIILSCNAGLLSILGEERGFLIGKSIWDYIAEPGARDLRGSISSGARRPRPIPLRLRGPVEERPVLCHVDVHRTHFVLVAELDSSEEATLGQRLFEMNNELAVASRELTRKTRELEEARRQIEDQARHDALTGLFNRRYLFERMNAEIARVGRGLHPVSLIMYDLDHFKRVNDEFGHNVGDEVLKASSSFVASAVRPYDVTARYGGEEFIVLLPGTTSSTAAIVAERLRAGVAALNVSGYPRAVTASFGVAEWREDETCEAWIARADAALYAGKHAGRNRVTLAEEVHHAVA